MAKHAGGRPTKYKEEYCDEMIDFFKSFLIPKERIKTDGIKSTSTELVAEYPTFMDFTEHINVSYKTLFNWQDKHKEFLHTYKKCQQIQHEIIKKFAISGAFNASFSIFAMKNIAGWRDKIEIEQKSEVTHKHVIQEDDLMERLDQLKSSRTSLVN